MKRGPRSAASLMLAAPQPLDVIERLKPPHHLVDEQVEIWQAIVSGHPADWFDAGSVPVLAQLCRHVVMSNRLAELIERTEETDELLLVIREQRSESEVIRKLCTSLRITPQSLTNHRGNKKPQITAIRPWQR
jgi:hypothetical protein